MKFQAWVDSYRDGPIGLANDLGVTPQAVKRWYQRKGFPTVAMVIKLVDVSSGTLSAASIIADVAPKSVKLPRGGI